VLASITVKKTFRQLSADAYLRLAIPERVKYLANLVQYQNDQRAAEHTKPDHTKPPRQEINKRIKR
jgi:hypothetical protein